MKIVKDSNSGYHFYVKDKDVSNHDLQEFFFIDWCKQFLKVGENFVDIGSDNGVFSIILSKLANKIYAFESCKDKFDTLTVNLFLNRIKNVVSHNIILNEIIEENSVPELDLDVLTLDSFHLENVGFLKFSCEGYEYETIKGSTKTLIRNNYPPFIFKSYHIDSLQKIKSFAVELGYKIIVIGGNNLGYMLAGDNIFHEKKYQDIKDILTNYQVGDTSNFTWRDWYLLSNCFRSSESYQKCFDCAKASLLNNPPDKDIYLPLQELSISSFYVKKFEDGFNSSEKLILSNLVPWNIRNLAICNQGFYLKYLQFRTKKHLTFDMPENYKPSSSSVIKLSEGYRVNLRAVNYYISNKQYGISRDSDGKIRTKNYILNYDNNLNLLNGVELIDKSNIKLYPKHILGMEDVRLFGDNYFFCNYLELNESTTPQMGWGTYDPLTGFVTRMVPLSLNDEIKCEKNWLPFIEDGEIFIIYTVHPLRILKLDTTDGKLIDVKNKTFTTDNITDFRGSAPPIKYDDDGNWLLTIHQVHFSEPRKYFHRFVMFDKHFEQMKFSKPFYFESPSVEFNLSICHSDNGLLMTYSQNDSKSVIISVDHSVINSMF